VYRGRHVAGCDTSYTRIEKTLSSVVERRERFRQTGVWVLTRVGSRRSSDVLIGRAEREASDHGTLARAHGCRASLHRSGK